MQGSSVAVGSCDELGVSLSFVSFFFIWGFMVDGFCGACW